MDFLQHLRIPRDFGAAGVVNLLPGYAEPERSAINVCEVCKEAYWFGSCLAYIHADTKAFYTNMDEALNRALAEAEDRPWHHRGATNDLHLVCYKCCGKFHGDDPKMYVNGEPVMRSDGAVIAKLTSKFQHAQKRSKRTSGSDILGGLDYTGGHATPTACFYGN